MSSTQLAVVGGGPGGYAAAFLAADLGLSVALIDPEANPGGVCVYRGCIPSKALLHVAKLLDESRHAAAWGIEFGEPHIDLARLRDFKNADSKNLIELSVELTQLSEKARNRKISLEEMQGGCFSVSNLGGIGGSFFTPIVNAPDVAILGISRARMEPVYDKASNGFVPRLMLPLSLSYDHRVIDGADGIRFLRWVVEALEQPFLLALQG